MFIIICLFGLLFTSGCIIDSPHSRFKNCMIEEMSKTIECHNPKIYPGQERYNSSYFLKCRYYEEVSHTPVSGDILKLCNRRVYGEP